MDQEFTKKIGAWLAKEPAERDFKEGATLFLQLSNNRIMYRNMLAAPSRFASMLEYQLQKYYNFRVQDLTHEEVTAMQAEADKIAEEHHLDTERTEKETEEEEFKAGKRSDHDSLPEEIQALYTENLPIMQQMRELHMKLRSLSTEDSPCPDSERYPFLRDLIKLDKQYHANWQKYDSYGKDNA